MQFARGGHPPFQRAYSHGSFLSVNLEFRKREREKLMNCLTEPYIFYRLMLYFKQNNDRFCSIYSYRIIIKYMILSSYSSFFIVLLFFFFVDYFCFIFFFMLILLINRGILKEDRFCEGIY